MKPETGENGPTGMKSLSLLPKGQSSRRLDPKLGMRMMLDLSVPLRWKVLAYAIGVVVTMVLEYLEIPLTLAAVLLPGGVVLDALIDGGEALVFPIWIACALLPRLYTAQRVTLTAPVEEETAATPSL